MARISTGDEYKEQTQDQWNQNPVGVHYAKLSRVESLEWFLEIERHRYGVYAPWMPEVMEFKDHAGHDVLEIGGGLGTDLSQFASNGARVTDVDLSAGHLALARRNFALRGLTGTFVHHDAETLPFEDNSFDVVYSNGVLHHTPNTSQVVREVRRVLRPGGKAIIMMYAEVSWHYLETQVWKLGLDKERLKTLSIGDIMSRYVEMTATESRPLVKVYTARRLRSLFEGFEDRKVLKRQLRRDEFPYAIRKWVPLGLVEPLLGWNLIIKARKPARG
jgi:ubiquinone/menaquinone biosynthesis C-methylase UbiE